MKTVMRMVEETLGTGDCGKHIFRRGAGAGKVIAASILYTGWMIMGQSVSFAAPPSIEVQPAAQTVVLGGTVEVSVSAAGTSLLTYQWFKDGRMLASAGASSLSITNAGVTNSGCYSVVVTNAEGLSISVPALVTVGTPQLMAWGGNFSGQLGDGSESNRSTTEFVASNVVSAAAGYVHTLYVTGDGTLWGMGDNYYGELGNEDNAGSFTVPIPVASNVVAAAAGAFYSLYVTKDGTLWATGYNSNGQLGNGSKTPTDLAEAVASNVVAVAAGESHSLFLKSDGTLWAMGANAFGQLGDGTTNDAHLPVEVSSNVVAAAVGWGHSLFLKADGTAWAAGDNQYGALGDGTTNGSLLPVMSASNIVALAAGGFHSLFLNRDGVLWATGQNNFGQLGNGTTNNARSPISVATNVTVVAVGEYHSLYLSEGMPWTMGENSYGQLGDGTTNNRSRAVSPAGMSLARIVAGGTALHTLAIGAALAPPPVITSQPASQSVTVGSAANFAVAAAGGLPPLRYQWCFEGAAIPGATATNYSLTAAQPTNAGTYTVVVSTAVGNITSSLATLSVGIAPVIVSQPTNRQSMVAGSTLTLAVNASGTPPLRYQWLKDGRMIMGATNATLKVANANVTDTGVYYAYVANEFGTHLTYQAAVAVGGPQLLGWGDDTSGELGLGAGYTNTVNTFIPHAFPPEPSEFGPLTNIVTATAGGGFDYIDTPPKGAPENNNYSYTLLVDSDGTLWSVGDNEWGQLGTGSANNYGFTAPLPIDSGVVSVTAGNAHTLFLLDGGWLCGWGFNMYGQLGIGTTEDWNKAEGESAAVTNDVVTVSAGAFHSLFVTSDGTLWGMGANDSGQLGDGTATQRTSPVPVEGGRNVVAVAAGYYHSLFLKSDGTLWAMGDNEYGELGDGTTSNRFVPILVSTNVVSMAAGYDFSVFVKGDGTVWSMGYNNHGQLGNGTTTSEKSPVSITNAVVAVAAGGAHAMLLQADGTLLTVGDNKYGQLGIGSDYDTSTPKSVSGILLASVTSGSYAVHSLAIGSPVVISSQPASQTLLPGTPVTFSVTATGAAPITYQWYFNGVAISGATGSSYTISHAEAANLGSYTVTVSSLYGHSTSSPATLTLIPPISIEPTNQIAAGQTVTLSLSTVGISQLAYQWVKNGQILAGATNSALTITNAGLPDSGVYYLALANSSGMALTLPVSVTVGTPQLLGWGQNTYYQLGDGTAANQLHPASLATNVLGAAAGEYHSLFVKADGTLWSMGYNTFGQLGDGTTDPRKDPVLVTNNVLAVAAGGQHSLFLRNDGSLWAMGYNNAGQLGDGSTTDRALPVPVATEVAAMAAGAAHSMFLKIDGTLWTMGANGSGQLGNGTTSDSSVPICVASNVVVVKCGDSHSLFIKRDGTLWAMGSNNYGELGDGTTTQRESPVPVLGGTNVLSTAGGAWFSLYLKGDGTLWGAGNNSYGQLGDGTTTQRETPERVPAGTNVTTMAAGAYHTLFLRIDGTLWAMGYNNDGELGDGTTTERNSPVAVSGMTLANINAGNAAFQSFAVGTFLPPAPVITNEPGNYTVTVGEPVAFSVGVSGVGPFEYQWYFNNGLGFSPISGATAAEYSLPSSVILNEGGYQVVVRNAGGSVTSSVASLTVNPAPTGVTLESSANPCGFGDTVTFVAQVTPSNLTGNVVFTQNGEAPEVVSIANGHASISLSSLPRGTNVIVAQFDGNGTYQASSATLNQVVTNHPPVAVPASYTLAEVPQYKILITSLATNWSDADGDSIALMAVNPGANGGSVAIANKYIVYSNASLVADQFSYVITDNHGGTNMGLVFLNAYPGPGNTNRTSNITGLTQNGDGSVSVRFAGIPGYTYVVQAATNLSDPAWENIGTNVAGTNGLSTFVDAGATNYPNRFYRTCKP